MSAKRDLAAKFLLNAELKEVLLTCRHFSDPLLGLPTYKIGKNDSNKMKYM